MRSSIILLALLLSACSVDDELVVGSGVVVNPQETRAEGSLIIEGDVYPGACPIVLSAGDYELGSWSEAMAVRREIREPGAGDLLVTWWEDCG